MADNNHDESPLRRQNGWLNTVVVDAAGANIDSGNMEPQPVSRPHGIVSGPWSRSNVFGSATVNDEMAQNDTIGNLSRTTANLVGSRASTSSSMQQTGIRSRTSTAPVAPLPLAHLPTIDDQVGNGLNNIFVSGEGRAGSARTAQHMSSGPLQSQSGPASAKHNFAHLTPQNMHKSTFRRETDQSRASKRRKLDTQSKEKEVSFRTKNDGGQERNWTFPAEIWFRILELSGLRSMENARKVHPSLKNHLDQKQHLWKNCRIIEFGSEAPEPPFGMSEKAFAGLIVGYGCQLLNCTRDKSLKVYWAFQRRLCLDCYNNNTQQLANLHNFQSHPQRALLDLIPAALFKSGKYQHARRVKEDADEWFDANESKLTFWTADVVRIENEYESLLSTGETPEQALTFLQARYSSQIVQNFRHLEVVETWDRAVKDSTKHRSARRHMFEVEAARMKEPISAACLNRMLPFHKALDSNRAPTTEQFELLRPKLIPLREEAARIVEVDRITNAIIMMGDEHQPHPEIKTYIGIHNHRAQRDSDRMVVTREQKAVLSFMNDVIVDVLDSNPADADLVLMVLFAVKTSWSSDLVSGKLFDGSIGPYQLSMDDARMIVEALQKDPRVMDSGRDLATVFRKFRCPACARNDKAKRYEFEELFRHLNIKHTHLASDFSKALRKPFAILTGHEFPWYTVPWPENIPVLATHQPANSITDTLVWNFDEPREYIQAPPVSILSIFAGRKVIPPVPDPLDFVSYVLHAGEVLAITNLKPDVQTNIALKYAIDCHDLVANDQIANVDHLAAAAASILTAQGTQIDHKLQFRFTCGLCHSDSNVSRSSRYVKGVRPVADLVQHWRSLHHVTETAASPHLLDLIVLKSDEELRDILDEEDEKLTAAKIKTAAIQKKRRTDVKKTPSEKADILLQKPFAWESFSKLWEVVNDEAGMAEVDDGNGLFFPDTRALNLED